MPNNWGAKAVADTKKAKRKSTDFMIEDECVEYKLRKTGSDQSSSKREPMREEVELLQVVDGDRALLWFA